MSILAHIGNTPLVPLRNLSRDWPFLVLGKCEHLNHGGSIQERKRNRICRFDAVRATQRSDRLPRKQAGCVPQRLLEQLVE